MSARKGCASGSERSLTKRSNVPDERQISIEDHGQAVSRVTVSVPDENSEARVHVHMSSGHLPAGTRQKVADAIHEAVTEDEAERLTAAVPRGDAELVDGISDQLSDAGLRATGATSLIGGQVKPSSW